MKKFLIIILFSVGFKLGVFAIDNNTFDTDGGLTSISKTKQQLQLSKEELGQRTTKDLLEICLNYPYIIDCLFYDNIQEGIDSLISDFNGFPELLSRTDFIDCALSKLEDFPKEIENVLKLNDKEKGKLSFQHMIMGMLISMDSVFYSINTEQKDHLIQAITSCSTLKKCHTDIFGSLSYYPYLLIKEKNTKRERSEYLNTDTIPITIYTPNESIVPDTYWIDGDDYNYTPIELSYLENSLYINYDGAILIGPPSKKYNCHAYAWRVSEGGSQVWIGYNTNTAENIYWTDSSYVEVPESLATKVSYDENTANHSAIRINSEWYQSKWGEGPLVKHHPNACPYNTSFPKKYYVRNAVITGVSTIYHSVIYTVENLLEGDTVVNWILSGNNAQNFIVECNTPSANQCRITRKSGVDFSGSYYLTLTAQVRYNGSAIKTTSKQLLAPYIEGNVVPCGYNVYSVVPHEANSTIEWEAEGSNITSSTDPLPSLPPEDPYAYVIANTEGRDIYGTLTATVKVGGSVIGTLEKVLDMSGLFSGTWWQQASALDTTNTSPAVFHHQDMLDIVPDRTVYLQSDDFIGANITKTINNMIALGWSNSNGIISFTPLLPINGGLGSITIEGTYPNSCRHFKLRLLTMSNFDDPILLSINPSGQTYGFSLISNQSAEHSTSSNSDIPTEWRLTITKSETGRRVFDSAVSGMTKTINTTEWRPGVYIAVAQVGKYTLSGKFAIER